LAGEQERAGHPVPLTGPPMSFTSMGIEAEASALAPKGKRLGPRIMIVTQMLLVLVLDKLGLTLGRFDPKQYKRDVSENSDFRKFDDGLKMTIDIDAEGLARIQRRLEAAERAGVCSYGLHRQNSALMTCIVTSPLSRDHVHFIDGASGGYAMASSNLKAKAAA
jgi:hypothetical protein